MRIHKVNEEPLKFIVEIDSDERFIEWNDFHSAFILSMEVPMRVISDAGNDQEILERYSVHLSKELFERLKNDSSIYWGNYGGYLVEASADLYMGYMKNNAYTLGYHFELLEYKPFVPLRNSAVPEKMILDANTQASIGKFENDLAF